MTPRELKALRAAIAGGVADALAPMVEELRQLRKALLDVETAEPGCVHPLEARINFGGMGDAGEEWECATSKGGCGYRHQPGEGMRH